MAQPSNQQHPFLSHPDPRDKTAASGAPLSSTTAKDMQGQRSEGQPYRGSVEVEDMKQNGPRTKKMLVHPPITLHLLAVGGGGSQTAGLCTARTPRMVHLRGICSVCGRGMCVCGFSPAVS